MYPIIDLHCDLLRFLERYPSASLDDPRSRCSSTQLHSGNVRLQTLAVYTATEPGSVQVGATQVNRFRGLAEELPERFERLQHLDQLTDIEKTEKTKIIAALENLSSCGEPADDINVVLQRLRDYATWAAPLLYVGLTWMTENRFAGGNESSVGLKDDGRRALEVLSELGIALDFSHTCDRTAEDILTFVNKEQLPLRMLTSHTFSRTISNVARNHTEALLQEIANRGGVIGLPVLRTMAGGPEVEHFASQLLHLLNLVGEDSIASGADFFCTDDGAISASVPGNEKFLKECQNASQLPAFYRSVQECTGLSEAQMEKWCFRNALRFIGERLG